MWQSVNGKPVSQCETPTNHSHCIFLSTLFWAWFCFHGSWWYQRSRKLPNHREHLNIHLLITRTVFLLLPGVNRPVIQCISTTNTDLCTVLDIWCNTMETRMLEKVVRSFHFKVTLIAILKVFFFFFFFLSGKDMCLSHLPLFHLLPAHLPLVCLLWLLQPWEPHARSCQDHWTHTR